MDAYLVSLMLRRDLFSPTFLQVRTTICPTTVCSLIATAKLNNVEPFAWLRDVLQRMTDGHPASRLDELLPWNWQPISAKT